MFENLYAYYDGRLKAVERELIQKLAGIPLFFYEARHDDDGDWVTPVTIERSVFVDFCNTVIFTEPLQFGDSDFIEIDEEEWDFDFPQISERGNEFVLPEPLSEHTVIVTEKSVLEVTIKAMSAAKAEEKVKLMYSQGSIFMDMGKYSAEFFCLRLKRDDVRVIAERLKLPVDEQALDEYFSAVQERYFHESEADPTASWDLIVEYILTSI